MKKCDRESARRRTDRQTHTHTDANRYYLSHAICYSYGTDTNLHALLHVFQRCGAEADVFLFGCMCETRQCDVE